MKPLLVGEANPYGANPDMALYPLPEHASGDRLCRLVMGLERRDYLRRFDRVNLCPQRWSAPEARENARAILADPQRTRIVLLGAKVCGAFGISYTPFDVWRWLGVDRVIVRLPHPSGLNRAWNEAGAFDRARAALRSSGIIE